MEMLASAYDTALIVNHIRSLSRADAEMVGHSCPGEHPQSCVSADKKGSSPGEGGKEGYSKQGADIGQT